MKRKLLSRSPGCSTDSKGLSLIRCYTLQQVWWILATGLQTIRAMQLCQGPPCHSQCPLCQSAWLHVMWLGEGTACGVGQVLKWWSRPYHRAYKRMLGRTLSWMMSKGAASSISSHRGADLGPTSVYSIRTTVPRSKLRLNGGITWMLAHWQDWCSLAWRVQTWSTLTS